MIRLLCGVVRETLGRWGGPAALGWLLFAAGAAADATLGSGSLGHYLALVAVLPLLLVFRLAAVAERRRRAGWDLEERLRDPRGWRGPSAELGAGLVLLGAVLLLAWAPTLAPGLRPARDQGVASRPLEVRTAPGEWRIALSRPCPPASRIVLLIDWQEAPAGAATLRSSRGRTLAVEPGVLARWDVDAAERMEGELVLLPPPGLHLATDWLRLETLRPGLDAVPGLLACQFLFFAPLLAIALALGRRGARAGLAGAGALGFATLATWRPPAELELGGSPLAAVVRALAWLAERLPKVDGLLATGTDFEQRAGTATLGAVVGWWACGVVAFLLARRWPDRAGSREGAR